MTPGDFPAFFAALTGHEPFPWQARLAAQVNETGAWPGVLDLPTGSGKTATLAIAVFALALDVDRPPEARQLPRRIAMVVDRRVVVDQAYRFARHMAKRLKEAENGLLYEVASRLRELAGPDGSPLETAILRGGMVRDTAWARSPSQPLIIASTVDQLGSRILFRGYGVSWSMRPVHAGLLANDTLILLDEVHLSQPFADTLHALEKRYGTWAETALPRRFQVVAMSATPGMEVDRSTVFQLDESDRDSPLLGRRLTSAKPTALAEVKISKNLTESESRTLVARHAARLAAALVRDGQRAVGVIVNRVDTARFAHRELLHLGIPAVLVTGRMRPLERDTLLADILPHLTMGRDRDVPPRVVVATQCVEAGADFDFDALVTQCASWDALRQRFGRLNRSGEALAPYAAILMRSDQRANTYDDPVYGKALSATWAWLGEQPGAKVTRLSNPGPTQCPSPSVDLGLAAAPTPPADALPELLAPQERAPVLFPSYLDIWSETQPPPATDPDIALFLHGPERTPDDVQLVWRADVESALLRHANGEELARAVVGVCPPSSTEAMTVSRAAVRAWLRGQPVDGSPDVEGERISRDVEGDLPSKQGRPCLRWRGEKSDIIHARQIRPGDTLVVPGDYGGLAHFNWDPESTEIVSDLGDQAHYQQRGRPVIRLHENLTGRAGLHAPKPDPEESPAETQRRLRDFLQTYLRIGTELEHGWSVEAARCVLDSNRGFRSVLLTGVTSSEETVTEHEYFALIGPRVLNLNDEDVSDATSDPDISSFIHAEITLQAHLSRVEHMARDFAQSLGLPISIVEDIALAGWLHDVGKADPRFQQMLCGGSAIRLAMKSECLAKSSIPAGDAKTRRRARELAGYPAGTRHELMSLAMIQHHDELRSKAHDWDLVLHLVASHHGWCRPFAPAVYEPDDEPVILELDGDVLQANTRHHLARVGSGVAQRFARLSRRYSWFGLAWLETILRLADHRVSAREEMGQTT